MRVGNRASLCGGELVDAGNGKSVRRNGGVLWLSAVSSVGSAWDHGRLTLRVDVGGSL
jgi:hypothetical protein